MNDSGDIQLPAIPGKGYGPVAWCHYCSRKHPRRKHDLELAERTAKSGRIVMRWVHPIEKPKSTRKARIRKS